MGTVTYTVLDGEILSENRNGVERDYVPDPLGSTVALLDNTQTQTDTFGYWPYGEVASRTGTTPTPYQYVGTKGYYSDNANRNYVLNRVLDKAHGRWLTVVQQSEQLGGEHPYEYGMDNPVSYIDPDGAYPRIDDPKGPNVINRKKYTNCKGHSRACIEHLFKKYGKPNDPCYQRPEMKNWLDELMACACVSGNKGADPLFLLAIAGGESTFGTAGILMPIIPCHNQFGIHFNPHAKDPHKPFPQAPTLGMLLLCKPGPNHTTLGPIPKYSEAACEAAKSVFKVGGVKGGGFNSGAYIKKYYPIWDAECKRLKL